MKWKSQDCVFFRTTAKLKQILIVMVDDCPICLEQMNTVSHRHDELDQPCGDDMSCYRLECGHALHTKCLIATCITAVPSCPICKKVIHEELRKKTTYPSFTPRSRERTYIEHCLCITGIFGAIPGLILALFTRGISMCIHRIRTRTRTQAASGVPQEAHVPQEPHVPQVPQVAQVFQETTF